MKSNESFSNNVEPNENLIKDQTEGSRNSKIFRYWRKKQIRGGSRQVRYGCR